MLYAVYGCVLLIWATTPLAIKIGATQFTPQSALTLRILLAFVVGSIVVTLLGRGFMNIRAHWKIYLAASIGLFPNMLLVYKSSEYISSGLISVLFGLSPFATALLAKPILGENMLNKRQSVALGIAVIGLVGIYIEQIQISSDNGIGVVLMLLSVLLFSTSNTLVKKLGKDSTVDSMELALGAMAFSLPGLLLGWVVWGDINITKQLSGSGLFSIIYLAIFGSLVGYIAYFYILKHMSFDLVSMIPLITPAMALTISAIVIQEPITTISMTGALLIIIALVIYRGWNKLGLN